MSNFILEMTLPRTDAGVFVQTIVMGIFWVVTITTVLVLDARREYQTFAVGLAMVNFAWFAARTVH